MLAPLVLTTPASMPLNGFHVNMFICDFPRQFIFLDIVDGDYPGDYDVRNKKATRCVFTRSLGLWMDESGSHIWKIKAWKTRTLPPSIWLSVGRPFTDIHFQKWKANRRLRCKSQAVTLHGVGRGINPPKSVSLLTGAKSIRPHRFDWENPFHCHC